MKPSPHFRAFYIFLLGLFCSGVAGFASIERDHREWESQFAASSDRLIHALDGSIQKSEAVLTSIRAFYDASDEVTRDEFATFTQPILITHPFLQALEWIPEVEHSQRDDLEAAMHAHGFDDFQFTERSQELLIRARERDTYYPVYFVEPRSGNELAHGFDLASNAIRAQGLMDSARLGKPRATAKIELVQASEKQAGFLVFMPIYRGGNLARNAERRLASLEGFALGVYRVGTMVEVLISDHIEKGLSLVIYDGHVSEETLLYGEAKPDFALERQVEMDVFDRKWVIFIQGDAVFHGGIDHRASGIFILSLLLITVIGAGVAQRSLSRAEDIEAQVQMRTRQLHNMNQALESEIEQRKVLEGNLRLAMEKAEVASRAKSDFLANMSHEIRTPMNGILGMVELLELTSLDTAQKDHIDTLKICGETLLSLINDILDVSRVESGNMTLERCKCDVRAVLNDINRMFQASMEKKGLQFAIEIVPELPAQIYADELRIKQVLLNLLNNAMKFTHEGHIFLCVSICNKGGTRELLFEVKDTGIGMSKEQLEIVFDPFTQADASTTRKYGGSGLGLAISKKLVTLMNGALWAESELKLGSTFFFTLPLEMVDEEKCGTCVIENHQMTFHRSTEGNEFLGERFPLRILLIDDNAFNRQVGIGLLNSLGYSAEVAESGKSGIKKAQNGNFDLIFMDLKMPDLDGLEVTRRIRAITNIRQPVIVAITANVRIEDKKACFESGMDGFIGKPFSRDDLSATIGKMVTAT